MRRYATLDSDSRKSRKPSTERESLTSRSNEADDLLLILTVDLGNDHLEQLPVRQGDEPMVLAKAFCVRHKLPPHLCEVLAETIECNSRQKKAPSSGDRTPTRKQTPKPEERPVKAKPDFSKLHSVTPEQAKSVRALVQRALTSKENITPKQACASNLPRNGSQSSLNKGHRRASSYADQNAEKAAVAAKPTHLRERSDQCGQVSPIGRQGAKSPMQRNKPKESEEEKVITQIKKHRYAEIFRAIKSPEENVLRASRIRTDLVHSGLIDILRPLLDELRDMGETLTLEEFQASMENLVAVLSKPEKNVLFYPFELNDDPEVTECTFKPQKASSHFRSVSTIM